MSEINAAPVGAKLENDREFKAHIYQQLVDLQPFLAADSQVAVLVEQSDDKRYVLTLVSTLGEYRIESEGQHANVYEAFGIAKESMIQQLDEWMNTAVDTTERDVEIQKVLEGGHLVH